MRTMAKHSFNSDGTAEEILAVAVTTLRDKTQFLNRLIQDYGPTMIHRLMDERNQLLRSSKIPTPGSSVKKKGRISFEPDHPSHGKDEPKSGSGKN
jgi:hypothetical protein